MSPKPHASFASAKEFALILTIPYLATVGFLIKHYFDYQSAVKPIDSTWFNYYWAYDTGLQSHLFGIGILTAGLGGAVVLLRWLDKLIENDERLTNR